MIEYNDDFGAALIESVDEAIKMLFSEEVLEALFLNLKERRSITREEIPNELPTLCIVLEKYFGPSSRTIGRMIARRLYAKLNLEFVAVPHFQLPDYVDTAKKRLL